MSTYKQCNIISMAFLVIAMLGTLRAQTFQAQVTGTVSDASGAAVPGAVITAKDLGTGATVTTRSNATGTYTLPYLRPGAYQVSCEVTGFKRFEQGPITLQVNQVLEVNITLEPGEVTQKLTVSGESAALATESASLSQVVTTRSIENLPLNIRDPYGLIALTPGSIMGSNFGVGGGTSDFGRAWFNSDYYVGGGRSGSQDVMIDGAPNVVGDFSKSIIDPPLDSVQEFSVQATNYSSQFGRSSGATVNMVTKSGTNALHGAAYGFERHSITDANYFFNNKSGLPLPSWSRHQFGGNVGGPVIKEKWFFFGDYEGLRQSVPSTFISTLPSPLQRTGDFSKTYASNGSLITIYDPSTLVTLPGGAYQRSPFPNNIIPASTINPLAAAVVKSYPQPNQPGNAVTGANNYVYTPAQTVTINKYDIRSDANLTEKTRMFARFSQERDERYTPGAMPAPIGGGGTVWDTFTQQVLDFTHVFSPATVADVNLSYLRGMAVQKGASWGFDLSSLGLPASYTSVALPYFPQYTMSDVLGTDQAAPADALQSQPRNVYAVEGSVSHQHGKHSLKFGEDMRWLHFNENQHNAAAGHFSFSRGFTQGPNPTQATATAGYDFASFLLGYAASGSIQTMSPMSTQGSYYGLYLQDDWRVTSKLTINLGLRWEINVGNSEKYDRIATWNGTVASPLSSNSGLSNLRGVVNWIGGNNPSTTLPINWKGIGPRVGLAYTVGRTVIRGGYGILYLPRPVYANGYGALETNQVTNMVASLNGLSPANTISNPFPTGIIPSLNDRNPLVNVGASITLPAYAPSIGYAQIWNFGIQRELPGHIVLDVHYWGNKGTHVATNATTVLGTVSFPLDQLPDQYLALGTQLNQLVPNPFAGLGLGGVLSGAQISRQQSLLPYPQYTGISQYFGNWGDSSYEAGSVQLDKRLSNTLTFSAVYTRSKNIDNVRTPIDAYNLALERGLAAFDIPNNFRLSWVYSIPFGRGRAHGSGANAFVNAVLGGWDFSSFVSLLSGTPIAVSRPSVNNGQSAAISNPSITQWFNTSVFTTAAPYTFGNMGPVLPDVRTDWTRNIDTVLTKNFGFAIAEKKITAQLRIECFNLFNTPQFATPNGTVTSALFGQVTSQANDPRDLQFALKILF
jgi:hypothetical protein